MSFSWWTDKQNVVNIHTKQYYSATKWNEVLIHSTTWINLENTMLSEEVRLKRPYIVWFHLYELSRIGKAGETESRLISLCQGTGRVENWGWLSMVMGFLFWGDGVLELDNGDGCIALWIYQHPLNCIQGFLILLCFTDTMFFYKSEACGNPVRNKCIGTIFPTASAHFVSLCHILVIFTILQTFSWLSYMLWWSVSSAL